MVEGWNIFHSLTKAIMTDKNIPSRFWDIVAEHCVVLNTVTSPTVDEPTKTIFEATYGQPPDYDALPPVGCYAVRLLEKQHRKDFRFDLTNQPGIFLGYATYNNIYGAVLFAEKALVVGRLQIAFDPNFFPLTDKSSDSPRFKFLHALLGRGSDAVLKSATNGKPLASPRPAVTAKSLAVNKLLLVGCKLKRFFPTLCNFVVKVSIRDEEQANTVAICYALTEVVADEKFSTNPA